MTAQTGDQIAWIEGKDVLSVASHEKFATVRGTDLYSLSGEFLNVHLENSDEARPPSATTPLLSHDLRG